MHPALLLVDLQNDYFPGGAMELVGSAEAGLQAEALLKAFRQAGRPVVHIQHVNTRPGATFFLPGSEGLRILASLAYLPGEPVFQKYAPNSFRDTPLLDHLRELGTTQLVLAGMMTHLCIDSTTRAAADLGFHCQLAEDACATRALTRHGVTIPAAQVQTAFLAALDGSFAKVMTTEAICAGL